MGHRVDRLVVVGAGLAALRTIEAARLTGWDGDVVLVGAEALPPYDRPPLSKTFLAQGHLDRVVPFRTSGQLAEELGVELLAGNRASGLDAHAGVVHLSDGRDVSYDSLVVTTGADPVRLPGSEVGGVTALRTADDAVRVRAALDAGSRLVVVGAGFIGSEVASAARKRGLPVVLIDSEPVPLTRSVGVQAGHICAGLHAAAGTDLRVGTCVTGFEAHDGRVAAVLLDDGTRVPADLVVVGVGARPATGWLRGSGVALHESDGGVLCGADLATSMPGIWAAGDVAHAPNRLFDGEVMRVEHWTNAAEHGAVAGSNAVRPDKEPALVAGVPYFWSDWYDHRLQFVGTPRADEVVVVGKAGPGCIVLYRHGDRLVGVLTIDGGADIMKLRRRIGVVGEWRDAVAFARERVGRRAPVPA